MSNPPGSSPSTFTRFPYVPARWYEAGPYSISTGACFGPTSGRRRVEVHQVRRWHSDAPGAPVPPEVYLVEVFGREREYLDQEGGLHRAASGYKLHHVPEHASFEAALEVADRYADGGDAPLVHQDTVRFEVVRYEESERYGVRSLWNGEPGSGGEEFERWSEANARSGRRNRAAQAAETRRARRA